MNSLSNKEADKGAIVSIIAYIFLSSLKIIISYIALSSALRADGLNNLTDIGASLAVLIGLKISRKPRDPDHPYGHSRAEQIASLVASFIMATVGLEVIVSAIQSFFNPQKTHQVCLQPGLLYFALSSCTSCTNITIKLHSVQKAKH